MENEAERLKFDLWLPRCLFGFFLGIQKEARRRLRPQARFGAQPPAGRHLARRCGETPQTRRASAKLCRRRR